MKKNISTPSLIEKHMKKVHLKFRAFRLCSRKITSKYKSMQKWRYRDTVGTFCLSPRMKLDMSELNQDYFLPMEIFFTKFTPNREETTSFTVDWFFSIIQHMAKISSTKLLIFGILWKHKKYINNWNFGMKSSS